MPLHPDDIQKALDDSLSSEELGITSAITPEDDEVYLMIIEACADSGGAAASELASALDRPLVEINASIARLEENEYIFPVLGGLARPRFPL